MIMDTRKVQRTGKSTFIVSLPKNWAMKNGVHAGSIIYITQSDNGALMLSIDRSEQDLKVKLDIGDKSGDPLIRDIIGCYVAGYRTMDVVSSHMSPAQKKDIHNIVGKLIGPEILEETINRVVMQDLLSSEELQSERALKRIRTVVKSMIQDSINSLVTNNKDLAHDVIHRDNDVDRLNLLISRQFTEILRSGAVKQKTLNSITAFNYMQASSNLERISDHASRIAEMANKCDCKLPEEIASELTKLESTFGDLIDDSITFLIQMNAEKANQLIDKTREIRDQIQILTNSTKMKDRNEMMVRLVVASSIERMLDYIMNIGELTINLSHAVVDQKITTS
jgi:phosphate uptake regulator